MGRFGGAWRYSRLWFQPGGGGGGQGENGGGIEMALTSILPGFDRPSAFHTTAACHRENVVLVKTRDLLDRIFSEERKSILNQVVVVIEVL